MYECLNSVVKIIKETDNECIVVPEFTGESLSGFYVDDNSQGRIPVNAAFYNNEVKLNQLIPDAINEAMLLIRNNIDQKLRKKYTQQYVKIGNRAEATGLLTYSGKIYNYLCIRASSVKGIILTINKIKIHLQNGLYTGNIKIIQDEQEIFNGTINTFIQTTFNLNKSIYILYEANPNNVPINIKHSGCYGCGNRPSWSPFMSVGSGSVDSENDLSFVTSDYSKGFEIEGYIDCDGFSFLCDGNNTTIDFQRSNFGRLLAKLIQQIARRNIGTWILTDENMTPYRLVNEEQIGLTIEFLNHDIEKMVNFAYQTYDFSDCYVCTGLYKQSIIV